MLARYFVANLVTLSLLSCSLGGNVEVKEFHQVVALKTQRRRSVLGFGTSLAITKPSKNGLSTLYVGAPLFRTPNQKSDEPADGALYKCVLNGTKPSRIACHHHIDLERRGGIGLSIDERDGKVLVCAPQFHFNCWNARIEQRQVGACYTVEKERSTAVLSSIDASCPAGNLTLDIMFVLDESASILHEDFNTTLVWITEVLRSFRRSIDQGSVHVGLITFAVKSTTKLELQYYSYKNFTDSVIRIAHAFGKATKTPLGIKQSAVEFQRNKYRRKVPKMMIVVTDGKADKGLENVLGDVAKKQRDGNVTMVAVGVGKDFSHEQLLSIAGKEENVLKVSSFKNLDSILETLRQVIIESAITILEGANSNATNDFAQSQQGLSAHISQRNHVFLGAPGSFDRIGSVFSYERPGPTIFKVDPNFFFDGNVSKIVDGLQSLQDSYLGYSLTSGFFVLSNTEFVVAGMPRYNCIGTVLIYEPNYLRNRMRLDLPVHLQQLGCYFGHSVQAVDINNDGLDDLLVSAPLYSETSGFDQGRVFSFINKPSNPLTSMVDGISSEILTGSKASGARFGMSLTVAGDIDRNGYVDIIVGAPLEENSFGAVYIYYGSSQGFNDQSYERIAGKQFGAVKYFGYAAVGNVDVDFNLYPDILVAAPLSDSVVIVRSKSVVEISTRIETSREAIDILECLLHSNDTCLVFVFCFAARQRSGDTGQVFDIVVDINLDALNSLDLEKRLRMDGKTSRQIVVQASHKERCQTYNLLINTQPFQNLVDLVALSKPIELLINYSLSDELENISMSPVLDRMSPNLLNNTWIVKPICSMDNATCKSHLNITAFFSIADSQNPVIYHEKSELFSVKLVVLNNGPDLSHFTTVKVVGTIKPSKVIGDCATLASNQSQGETTLHIQNPYLPVKNMLESQASCGFILQYDTQLLTSDLRQNKLEIAGEVFLKGHPFLPSKTPGNNTFLFSRDIRYSVPLILSGESIPSTVYYNYTERGRIIYSLSDASMGGNKTNVFHQYNLLNRNPLPLTDLPLTFTWPSHTMQGEQLLYLVNFACGSTFSCKCNTRNSLNSFKLPESNVSLILLNDAYPVKLDPPQNDTIPENPNCQNVNCSSFSCIVTNLTAFSTLKITAQYKVWLPTFLNKSTSSNLFSSVIINTSHLALLEGGGAYRSKVITHVIEYETPFNDDVVQQPVNIWIIIGSILGGLLLLIMLIILVWKGGFFESHYGELLQAQRVERQTSQSVVE